MFKKNGEMILIFSSNILLIIADCHYKKFGPNLVTHKEGKNIHSFFDSTLRDCEVACDERPNCHSFQYDDVARKCDLKNKVLRQSEPTKQHFRYTTYYKPCGKQYSFNKNMFKLTFLKFVPNLNFQFHDFL